MIEWKTANAEEIFLEQMSIERVFELIERKDYLFLYHIKQCLKNGATDGVYLTDLAKNMKLTIPEISKAIKSLEKKGYIMWKIDENTQTTYVTLTNNAIELCAVQKNRIKEIYEKIIENIPSEDLETTLVTMSRVKELMS